jgi:FkbM family methyltransferase
MKTILKRCAIAVGINLERLGRLECELAKLKLQNGEFTFVQIGAYDGVSFDGLYWLVQKYNGRGIVVEPLKDVFTRLKANYEWLPRVKAVCVAVHPVDKVLTLYRVDGNADSQVEVWAKGSTSTSKNWLEMQGVPDQAIYTEVVPACHLNDIIALGGFGERGLDLLQVDAEGLDHEVIRMLNFSECKPKIIKYEHTRETSHLALEKEREMRQELTAAGYQVVKEGDEVVAFL